MEGWKEFAKTNAGKTKNAEVSTCISLMQQSFIVNYGKEILAQKKTHSKDFQQLSNKTKWQNITLYLETKGKKVWFGMISVRTSK